MWNNNILQLIKMILKSLHLIALWKFIDPKRGFLIISPEPMFY